jgi:putative RecB family exonuclease
VFVNPLPSYLSPSRLSDVKSCPRKYQHASVDRIYQPSTYASTKGRFVHFVLEQLFSLPSAERTIDRARQFIPEAIDEVITDEVRTDLAVDDALLSRLHGETTAILDIYFQMEDPRTITVEGVERKMLVEYHDTPLYGILDRLDRDPDGRLVIVDYKTGSVPPRRYDTQTFANAELYAALCAAELGELPASIRLLYVAHGQTLERFVTPVVTESRAADAARAWRSIQAYYNDGHFPATPSPNACRFCAFKDLCRSNGVAVAVR